MSVRIVNFGLVSVSVIQETTLRELDELSRNLYLLAPTITRQGFMCDPNLTGHEAYTPTGHVQISGGQGVLVGVETVRWVGIVDNSHYPVSCDDTLSNKLGRVDTDLTSLHLTSLTNVRYTDLGLDSPPTNHYSFVTRYGRVGVFVDHVAQFLPTPPCPVLHAFSAYGCVFLVSIDRGLYSYENGKFTNHSPHGTLKEFGVVESKCGRAVVAIFVRGDRHQTRVFDPKDQDFSRLVSSRVMSVSTFERVKYPIEEGVW